MRARCYHHAVSTDVALGRCAPRVHRARDRPYTDGVLEASSEADEFFSQTRRVAALKGARPAAAGEAASTVLREVGRSAGYNRGRPQEDDLTVLVIDTRSEPVPQTARP